MSGSRLVGMAAAACSAGVAQVVDRPGGVEDSVGGRRVDAEAREEVEVAVALLVEQLTHARLELPAGLLSEGAQGLVAEDRLEELLPQECAAAGDPDLRAGQSGRAGEDDDH